MRYIGVDLHTTQITVCYLKDEGEISIRKYQLIEIEKFVSDLEKTDTAFESSIAIPTSSTEMHIATIDANRDGKDDLVIGRLGGFLLYHGNSALFTRTENDFDGDLKTDSSVFRPSNGVWFINRSIGGFAAQQWGLSGDKLTPADYDGDGKTDLAVWRDAGFGNPAFSYFFIFRSSTNTLQQEQFGRAGDVPTVVGDWDGDGRADPAVYRNGATAGAQSFFFYRPSSIAGADFRAIYWGVSGDAPVRGDGRTDFAIVRPPNNDWYILNSATGAASYRQWGANSDALVPGDYNGDGKTEVATYCPSEGNWYIPQCADYTRSVQRFGASGDVAVPSAFVP